MYQVKQYLLGLFFKGLSIVTDSHRRPGLEALQLKYPLTSVEFPRVKYMQDQAQPPLLQYHLQKHFMLQT